MSGIHKSQVTAHSKNVDTMRSSPHGRTRYYLVGLSDSGDILAKKALLITR